MIDTHNGTPPEDDGDKKPAANGKKPRKQQVRSRGNRHPDAHERVRRILSPRERRLAERMYLDGITKNEIAKRLHVKAQIIRAHIDKQFRPRWDEEFRNELSDAMARIMHLYRLAMERHQGSDKPLRMRRLIKEAAEAGADMKVVGMVLERRSQNRNAQWLQVAQWCLETRLKLGGFYREPTFTDKSTPHVIAVVVESREEADRVMSYEQHCALMQRQVIPKPN